MKNLAKSLILILGLGFISFQSNASESIKTTSQNPAVTENPWEVFKEVIHAYKTSNVQFYFTPKDQQEAFLNAAEEMKQKIAEKSDFHAEEKLKRIDQTVTIFKFLWETKDETEYTEIENIEIPEIQ
jgi:RecB family exonuclease